MSNAILNNSKFIHIPKCGGTSVQAALWYIGCIKDRSQSFVGYPIHHGHLFASQMPEDDKSCFTFIRNPISWWHSYYHWNKTSDSRFILCEKSTLNFDQWISEYGQFWLGHYSKLIRRYLGEDENFPTENKIRLIGKTENLHHDLRNILDTCGEPYIAHKMQELIDKNLTSNAQTYNKQISLESKNIIYNTEKEIFDRFNYTIDDI
jgi:hypothetical protein